MYQFGSVQKKILLVLLGCIALGFSGHHGRYFRILRQMRKEWKKINQQSFQRSFKRLTHEKFIKEKRLSDGSFELTLTEKGKKQAKILSLIGDTIKFKKPKRWNGKWCVVLFDIPEKSRMFRDILRDHLRALEFLKLQHSVFVSPYPFEQSILELVSLYEAEQYVRIITADKINNQFKIEKHFKLA